MTDEEIDNLIDEWHNDQETTLSLHEYLGWTWEQYARYVESGTIPEETCGTNS